MSSANTTGLKERFCGLWEWMIPTILCAVLFGQVLFSSRQLSQTADEVTHLYSGYRYLKCGDLTISPEHPPLAKIIAAAPLLPMNLAVTCAPFRGTDLQQSLEALDWVFAQDWHPAFLRARLAVSVFAVALCLLVWMAARRMFDLPTAVVATVLVAFEPNVLAFSGLIMTDVPVTCMFLFAVYAFYCWTQSRSAPMFLLAALAMGLSLLAKHSGLMAIPIFCVLALVGPLTTDRARISLRAVVRALSAVGIICVIAFAVVWMGYGMRFSSDPENIPLQQTPVELKSATAKVLTSMKNYRVLPKAYLDGFAEAFSISRQSGPVFLNGRIYPRPPWFTILFYLLVRSTLAVVVLFALAVVGILAAFRQQRREVLFVLIPAIVCVVACFHSSLIGIRYLLPAIPFLLILIAAGCVDLARRYRWAGAAVAFLIVLHAASSLHAFPNYLSYANEFWGGPAQAYKYLPMLDAGQAYPEAKSYLERHPAGDCWLITGWQWDPALYGIPCHTFSPYLPNEIPFQVHGTVIVSSSLVTDVRLSESSLAAPFKQVAPKYKIGGSALLVYEGDFDTTFGTAAHELVLMMASASIGQRAGALQHGNRAAELAPDSAYTRGYLCLLLSEFGQADAAQKECLTAQSLLLSDPMHDETTRKNFLIAVRDKLGALQQSRTLP
ncbi:MAG: phospholipid carrier-dependent glycosyltransferase [Terriglobales bacterium]